MSVSPITSSVSNSHPDSPPSLDVRWADLIAPDGWPTLATVLLAYARPRRWFRAKARRPEGARLLDLIPLDGASAASPANLLALLEIAFQAKEGGGSPAEAVEVYAIPLARADGNSAESIRRERAQAIVATARDGLLVDGLVTGQAAGPLLALVRNALVVRGTAGKLRGESTPELTALPAGDLSWVELPRVEQSNSIMTFGGRVLLKVYRQVASGPAPELEIGRFLSERCDPPCTPRVMGALSYHSEPRADAPAEVRVLAIAHEFLANDGDAWSLARSELAAYFERVDAVVADPPARTDLGAALEAGKLDIATLALADGAAIGRFEMLADTLGRRTGELHLALAGIRRPADGRGGEHPDFSAEPLSASDRAGLAARVSSMLDENLAALAEAVDDLSPAARALAAPLLADGAAARAAAALLARWRAEPLTLIKTRTHGDLHLGQVLARGDDFTIIDFEGEPGRPPAERRAKSSPIRDVMSMVRSFDYAPEAVLRERASKGEGDRARWEQAAARWTREVTDRYLAGYRATVGGTPILPRGSAQLSLLFAFYELEKVIYELGYELNNRPEWVEIPLRGLTRILAPTMTPVAGSAGASPGAETHP